MLTLLRQFENRIPIRLVDADGVPLSLDGAIISVVVENSVSGDDLFTPDVDITDLDDGRLVLTVAASDVAMIARRPTLSLVVDLGAGVVYPVKVRIEALDPGPEVMPEGRVNTLEESLITVDAASGVVVSVEWAAVRDLGAAIAAAEVLIQTVEDIEGGAVADMIEARDQALGAISTAGGAALSDITDAGSGALSDITDAGTAGVQAVQQQQTESVEAVEQAETTTITQATAAGVEAVQQQQTTSVAAVATREGQAVDAVEQQEAQSEAAVLAQELASVEAVEEEGDTQVQRVEDEGDTQVGRLDERVPDPSEEPDERFLATLGGQSLWVPKPEGMTPEERLGLVAVQAVAGFNPAAVPVFDSCRRDVSAETDAIGTTLDSGQTWEVVAGNELQTQGLYYQPDGTLRASRSGGSASDTPQTQGAILVAGFTHDAQAEVGVWWDTGATTHFHRYLILHWIDPDNWLAVRTENYSVRVILMAAGTETVLASHAANSAFGYGGNHRNLALRAIIRRAHSQAGTRTIEVYQHGNPIIHQPLTEVGAPLLETAGQIGFSVAQNSYLSAFYARA